MTCDQVLQRLPDDLGGKIAHHLESCPRCRAELQQLRVVRDELSAANADSNDSAMLAAVRQQVLAQIAARPWMGRLRWAAAGGLAVAAAAAVLWPAQPRGPLPTPMALALPQPPDVVHAQHRRPARPTEQPAAPEAPTSEPAIRVVARNGAQQDPNSDLLLELESGNSEVLLYWLIEPAGD